jgi:hypothetical protein
MSTKVNGATTCSTARGASSTALEAFVSAPGSRVGKVLGPMILFLPLVLFLFALHWRRLYRLLGAGQTMYFRRVWHLGDVGHMVLFACWFWFSFVVCANDVILMENRGSVMVSFLFV